MSRQVEIEIKARRQFEPLLTTDRRWSIVVAHRRAGKTVACIQKLIKSALECHKREPRYAYVAPLYSQAKDVAWEYLKHFTKPLAATPNETELRVDLPDQLGGARIRLYGADNPDRLRGLYLDGVVLDEFADMRPSVWGEVVRPMLADRLGWATFIGTPKGHNEFHAKWLEANDNPDWLRQMLRASETGILPPEELESARQAMSQDQYDQEFECSFEAAIQGAYFAVQMRRAREEGRIGKVPLDPSRPVNTFWDIGKRDSTSIWFHQNAGQMHHLVGYYENAGEGVDHYARFLKDYADRRNFVYGKHYGPHDLDNTHWILPGAEAIQDVARRVGIDFLVVPRIHNKMDAIEAARNFLSMCWIDEEHCKEGIECLDNYRKEWDDQKRTWKANPRHDWASHGADALQTGACGFTPDYVPPPSDRYERSRTRSSAWAA